MVKLLKTMVVLNLLLGGGALYLGLKIFQDREIIKKRTQTLENTAQRIASGLEWDKNNRDRLAANIMDVNGMDAPLADLSSYATQTKQELTNTQADLAETRTRLAQTEDKLASTEAALNSANREIDTLRTDLARTNDQLTEARRRVDTLSLEVSDLKRQINDLNDSILNKDREIDQLSNTLATTQQENKRLEEQINILLNPNRQSSSLEGTVAKIIAVNREWNFVVVDKGTRENFIVGARCVIGRSGVLLAEATVSMVEESISVADVDLSSIPEGFMIEPGDIIFFPPKNL